jgi:hypothetical protein
MIISGLRWILSAIGQAATAELDDDTPLREALLEAGLRLQQREITEEEYAQIEEIVLARMREIRERRQAAAGVAAGDVASRGPIAVEATILGDFHQPAPPVAPRRGGAAKRRRVRLPSRE